MPMKIGFEGESVTQPEATSPANTGAIPESNENIVPKRSGSMLMTAGYPPF